MTKQGGIWYQNYRSSNVAFSEELTEEIYLLKEISFLKLQATSVESLRIKVLLPCFIGGKGKPWDCTFKLFLIKLLAFPS